MNLIKYSVGIFYIVVLASFVVANDSLPAEAVQWQEIEVDFKAETETTNPYIEVEAWVDFVHEDGTTIRRQAAKKGATKHRHKVNRTKGDCLLNLSLSSTIPFTARLADHSPNS